MSVHTRRLAPLLLAAACVCEPALAQEITAIGSGTTLVSVDPKSPSTVVRTRQITGLGAGQSIIAFDARPQANGRVLYGLSNTGQLYAINARTGTASAIGAPIALNGTAFGLDFNPTVDRIRIISNTGQNLRVNPDTGAVTVDGRLNVLVAGQPIPVTGNTAAAYTNNFAGATSTTLYVINTETGLLQIQAPPNAGTLTVVGGLGGEAAGTVAGFDIARSGQNRVTVIQDGVTNVYSIDLKTGQANFIGQFATGVLQGLTYTPAAFASAPGLTPNQMAVGDVFDNFTSVAPGFVPLLNVLDALPDDAARAEAFTQLGPVSFGILPEVVLQTTEFVDGTLRTYMRDRRAGEAGNGSVDADTMERHGMGGMGGFLVGTGRTGDFKARGDRGEIDYGATGFIGALDAHFGTNAMAGITVGVDRADVRLSPVSPNSRGKGWFVGGYGSLGMGKYYVDLAATYGKMDFDLRRNVAFGGFSSSSLAETDGSYYSLSATTGTTVEFGSLELEPYFGARYADVSIDGFSEGEGLTNLTVGDQDVQSLQSLVGLRVAASREVLGATVRPSVRAEYRHEFKDDEGREIVSSFNGTGIDQPFVTTTSPMGNDRILFGAGLTISGNSPVSVLVDYTAQMGGGYRIHGLQVGARLSF
jgi:uncharacterized protein with beta-barrel porin domain